MNEPNPNVAPAPAGSAIPHQERQWALAAHLSALSGFVIPLGSVLGPLIVWLVKREEFAFVDDQGKEALNFNILVLIGVLVLVLLTFGTFGIGVFITLPLGIALSVLWFVFTIIAGIKANEGVRYRYPFNLRIVK